MWTLPAASTEETATVGREEEKERDSGERHRANQKNQPYPKKGRQRRQNLNPEKRRFEEERTLMRQEVLPSSKSICKRNPKVLGELMAKVGQQEALS